MKGALVIFIAMVVIGIILYLTDVFYYRKRHPRREEEADANINFADSEKPTAACLMKAAEYAAGHIQSVRKPIFPR